MTITHANMSDEDRDVDIESDDDVDPNKHSGSQFQTQAEKRAHHNALERKRRDHIKDSFSGLRDSIPSLQGEKASRAQILKKAADYIQFMRRKNSSHQQDIDDLKRQNQLLETQTIKLQRQRSKMKPHSQIKYGQSFITDTSVTSDDKPTSSSVRSLEKAKTMGTFSPAGVMDTASLITNPKGDVVSAFDGGSGSESSDSESSSQSRRKKMKTGSPTTSSSGT